MIIQECLTEWLENHLWIWRFKIKLDANYNKYLNIKLSNKSFLNDFCNSYSVTFERLVRVVTFQRQIMELLQDGQHRFTRQPQLYYRISQNLEQHCRQETAKLASSPSLLCLTFSKFYHSRLRLYIGILDAYFKIVNTFKDIFKWMKKKTYSKNSFRCNIF